MRIIQILSVTVILVALNTTQAWAGAVNQCSLQTLRPDDRIDPGVAIGVCKQAVEAEPTPQHYFQLGRALYAAERYDESAQWFERAAAGGHAEALFALGKSYYFGYGVKKDVLKGGRTMREAAQAGSVRAQDYVASLQFRGAAGVGGGRRQAMLGWKQAAEQGYANAQRNFAMTYETGKGQYHNKPDLGLAAHWYREAALQGHPAARRNLIAIYADHPSVEAEMQRRFGANALPPVRPFTDNWPYGSSDAVAQMSDSEAVAACIAAGTTPWQQLDATSAVDACKRAAETETSPEINYGYGRSLMKAEQYAQARQRLQLAADKGYANAVAQLGWLHEYGKLGDKDLKRAMTYYHRSAQAGSSVGQAYLGYVYFHGRPGVARDYQQALYWNTLAAQQGHGAAQNMLGAHYFDGLGVAQDYKKAGYWLAEAVENGDTNAIENLSVLQRKLTELENQRIAREAEAQARAANQAFNELATDAMNN
jgi:TPR repeat protein